MRLLSRMLLPFALLTFALTGPVVASAAAATPGHVVGHVYLDDNTAAVNTIAGFARYSNGALVALPGSPFAAGGAGAGAGLASQGAVQFARDGRYLLAVDAGSNQISVLTINSDGSLTPVSTGPVSSGGIKPVSIAVHGDLVYVANAGNGVTGSNYTGFVLTSGGVLEPIIGSTVALSPTAQPGDVLFNATGTELVGTEVNAGLIDSFNVGRNGLLYAVAGSPFTAQGAGPFGSEFSPVNSDQLFVSNAHGGTAAGTISAFTDADGTLSPIGASPFADGQTAPCWVTISRNGQYLFAINTGSGDISSFAITPSGSLSLLGTAPVSATGGVGAVDPGLSPDGRALYVNESRIDAVGEFTVNGGTVSELASSPVALPVGATPAGIAVN